MLNDRLALGGAVTALGGLGSGYPLVAVLAPAVRYYFHNRERRMWYGSLGPTIAWNDYWTFGVQLGGGLHVPVAESVLFSPSLLFDYGGERIVPVLTAGIELLLGNTRATGEGRAPLLERGGLLLGTSSVQFRRVRELQDWSVDLSAHYFLLRRFALSARVLAGITRTGTIGREGSVSSQVDPGFGLRYYWNAGQPLLWFTDTAIDFGDYTAATLATGVNYFVGQHLALEYGLFLQTTQSRTPVVGQSFGVRLYWGEKETNFMVCVKKINAEGATVVRARMGNSIDKKCSGKCAYGGV